MTSPREQEVEGEWIMGWAGRKRPSPRQIKDAEGRLVFQLAPVADLQGPITPTDLRYVVNQLEIPDPVHPDDWSLAIGGEVEQPLRLTLAELEQFPGRTVRVVTECAGSDERFDDYVKSGGEKPDRFDLNTPGAGIVSSGEFTGVPLALVLEKAGLRPEAVSVRAEGFDQGKPSEWAIGGAWDVPERINFDKCLPLEKALDPDTILAWAMNGEYLRHIHGAPVRLVVPGWSGNWSVKWLQELDVLDHMAPCFYQTQYFYLADSADDPNKEMITAMGVRSVITEPRDGQSLGRGSHLVRGLAWSGVGAITKVEVSVNGGPWQEAHLEEPREKWLWVRWSYLVSAEEPGSYSIRARASDEAGRTQPQMRWNFMHKMFDGIVAVDFVVE
ncbi:MAG: molybdopterin-dependent oxidoreductase [Dehalococcoidia bacterium]